MRNRAGNPDIQTRGRLDVGQEYGQHHEQADRRYGATRVDGTFTEAVPKTASKHGGLFHMP